MLKKTKPKLLSEIEAEWDSVCRKRQDIINSGKDFSLTAVTSPCILEELGTKEVKSILDVGCGSGYLTSLLAQHAKVCIGIDISSNSINIAESLYKLPNLKFVVSSISNYQSDILFDICVANMVFSCDPDWTTSISAIHALLAEQGQLFVMLPHPCFWAKYWDFDNDSWFNYSEETYIEHNFSVTLAKSLGTATYIHRPLSLYIRKICELGFVLENMKEPYPVSPLPDQYTYDYPRFIFLKFSKNNVLSKNRA